MPFRTESYAVPKRKITLCLRKITPWYDSQMRALVTGGTGRIGTAVAERLRVAGWSVLAAGRADGDVARPGRAASRGDAARPGRDARGCRRGGRLSGRRELRHGRLARRRRRTSAPIRSSVSARRDKDMELAFDLPARSARHERQPPAA